jgi:hypothetical protein
MVKKKIWFFYIFKFFQGLFSEIEKETIFFSFFKSSDIKINYGDIFDQEEKSFECEFNSEYFVNFFK